MGGRTETRCARCGRAVEAGEVLCELCREEEPATVATRAPGPVSDLDERARRWPATMVRPSPVQYHATVMVTIFLILAGLAAFAFIRHHGVGPFPARVQTSEAPVRGTIAITIVVRNGGTKQARANCALSVLDNEQITLGTDSFLTAKIDPRKSVTVRRVVRGITRPPAGYDVSCS